jgi:hypothetical protein
MPHSFQAAMSGVIGTHDPSDSQGKEDPARFAGNDAAIRKLERLEADLRELQDTLSHGDRALDDLRSSYAQLTSSMEALLGSLQTT